MHITVNGVCKAVHAYVRNARASEPKQPVSIVALHNPDPSCRARRGKARSAVNGHQLQVKDLLSLFFAVITCFHDKRFELLSLPILQVSSHITEVVFRWLAVELSDF